ncbi:uncharacterized protein LOC133291471 [Gastrolobium bilobum]|uniref:uncharacterized protein LOC133291471 n=1 Tax=Gastrolobium bilobum TaxID=150636 RepID=UPI002AB00844|nr:uncharacterized protein LOC133291471 [Gastrolobium bilobum]
MENNEKDSMVHDIVLQVIIALVMAISFLFMHDIPKKMWTKFRLRNRADIQAKRHFVQGAQLLARARSSKSRTLAKEAIAEAERAISLDPRDAANYLLKALVLDFQGFRTSALDSLDVALSPLAAKSLTDAERGDALLKRAELKLGTTTHRANNRVDSAIADLNESVKLSANNARAFCVLGECYEKKKMNDDARKAYHDALQLDPQLRVAQQALLRFGS